MGYFKLFPWALFAWSLHGVAFLEQAAAFQIVQVHHPSLHDERRTCYFAFGYLKLFSSPKLNTDSFLLLHFWSSLKLSHPHYEQKASIKIRPIISKDKENISFSLTVQTCFTNGKTPTNLKNCLPPKFHWNKASSNLLPFPNGLLTPQTYSWHVLLFRIRKNSGLCTHLLSSVGKTGPATSWKSSGIPSPRLSHTTFPCILLISSSSFSFTCAFLFPRLGSRLSGF